MVAAGAAFFLLPGSGNLLEFFQTCQQKFDFVLPAVIKI